MVNEKVKRILEEEQRLQGKKKPTMLYCRNQSWNHEPCDFCGSKEGIREVNGRYIASNDEDDEILNEPIFMCGNCLDNEFEKIFDAVME